MLGNSSAGGSSVHSWLSEDSSSKMNQVTSMLGSEAFGPQIGKRLVEEALQVQFTLDWESFTFS